MKKTGRAQTGSVPYQLRENFSRPRPIRRGAPPQKRQKTKRRKQPLRRPEEHELASGPWATRGSRFVPNGARQTAPSQRRSAAPVGSTPSVVTGRGDRARARRLDPPEAHRASSSQPGFDYNPARVAPSFGTPIQFVAVLHGGMLPIVKPDPVCRRLMTVPGVGALVAITFKSAVDDPGRFARSRVLGALAARSGGLGYRILIPPYGGLNSPPPPAPPRGLPVLPWGRRNPRGFRGCPGPFRN